MKRMTVGNFSRYGVTINGITLPVTAAEEWHGSRTAASFVVNDKTFYVFVEEMEMLSPADVGIKADDGASLYAVTAGYMHNGQLVKHTDDDGELFVMGEYGDLWDKKAILRAVRQSVKMAAANGLL